ncbi:murein biosynthesis integral membrane protein MurJ [Herbivorax sp. ANBcel31]|uniref:murein biosynthesis integral membrane protein MurJ n=1 Tax=Herbivorax sp. ANBcel31 TaxID=3069754 RepID=UPI0027B05202|nr:murein biosynthesis integral membrane protein MurJ [Herbivorax sp. ANBcel31]MDQ2086778.1 murein biosynthesis integral membrane protein MurJ [Herbivorax sp. ANBcel31]
MSNKRLGGAAAIVMSSIVVSRITGYIREMVTPNVFGLGSVGDAYSYAFRITGLMYDLLVGGAIAAAIIPVLTGYISKKDEENGWKAVGTFINIVIIVMSFVCVLGMFFAPQLIGGFSGFECKEQIELTADIARILFPSVAFLMLAGISNGVLNSYQRFAAAAYGPSIYNVGSILSLIFLSGKGGPTSVAYGIMASSLVYFLFQLSFAYKNLKHYKFKIHIRHSGFIKLIKLAIPSLMASSVVQINVIIASFFATFFEPGSMIILNMADRTWQMPYGIFAQGMGIAMLPTLSAYFSKEEFKEYKSTLIKCIKTVLLFTIPSAVGFIVLRENVIRTLFDITGFDSESIALAGRILMFFSIALFSQSIVNVLNKAYYAAKDTITPLITGVFTIGLNFLLSVIFIKATNIGVAGMALSYSLVSLVNASLLLMLLNRKMNGIYIGDLLKFLSKIFPASFVMGLAVYFINTAMPFADSKIMQYIGLLGIITVGAAVYFAIVLLFKVEEASYAKNIILKKFGKKSD